MPAAGPSRLTTASGTTQGTGEAEGNRKRIRALVKHAVEL